MPRDNNGTYTLPPDVNPVVPGTVISTDWANPTLDDVAVALTNSLDRYGRGGMEGPFLLIDGTIDAPGLAFVNDPTMGLRRKSSGVTGASGFWQFDSGILIEDDIAINHGPGTGAGNTFIGQNVGTSMTTGIQNTAIGRSTLTALTDGSNNFALGTAALNKLVTGNYNVGIGFLACGEQTSGSSNVGIGYGALWKNVSGGNSTAIGNAAMSYFTGQFNTAVGASALYGADGLSTGQMNVGMGVQSLYAMQSGSNNVGIGVFGMGRITTGSDNVGVGHFAGAKIADGGNNVTGSKGVFIGSQTRAFIDGGTNEIVIGADAVGRGSNTTVLGNAATTNTWLGGIVYGAQFDTLKVFMDESGVRSWSLFPSGGTFYINSGDGLGPVHIGGSLSVGGPLSATGTFTIPNIILGVDAGSGFIDGPAASGYLEIRTHGGATTRGFVLGTKDNNGTRYPRLRFLEDEGKMHLTPTLVFDSLVGTTERALAVLADGTVTTAAAGGFDPNVTYNWGAIQHFNTGFTTGALSTFGANVQFNGGATFGNSADAGNSPSVNVNAVVFAVRASMFTVYSSSGATTPMPLFYMGDISRYLLSWRNNGISLGDTRILPLELASGQNPTWWNGTTQTPLAGVLAVALVNADGTVVKQRGFASITHTGVGQYAIDYSEFDGQGTLVALQRGTDGVRVVAAAGASSGTVETWVGGVQSDQPFLVMLLAL